MERNEQRINSNCCKCNNFLLYSSCPNFDHLYASWSQKHWMFSTASNRHLIPPWLWHFSVFPRLFQHLSTQKSEFCSVISASGLIEWVAHTICRHSGLSWLLLERWRSLRQAAEMFILLSTTTVRPITALGGSWRNITAWSTEMTKLQERLALWCTSNMGVNILGFFAWRQPRLVSSLMIDSFDQLLCPLLSLVSHRRLIKLNHLIYSEQINHRHCWFSATCCWCCWRSLVCLLASATCTLL